MKQNYKKNKCKQFINDLFMLHSSLEDLHKTKMFTETGSHYVGITNEPHRIKICSYIHTSKQKIITTSPIDNTSIALP